MYIFATTRLGRTACLALGIPLSTTTDLHGLDAQDGRRRAEACKFCGDSRSIRIRRQLTHSIHEVRRQIEAGLRESCQRGFKIEKMMLMCFRKNPKVPVIFKFLRSASTRPSQSSINKRSA